MALTRVQATGKVATSSTTSHALTWATPPTVGNGVIVVVVANSTATVTTVTCSDNKSNPYVAVLATPGANDARVNVFYCQKVLVSGAPFTVTVTTDIATFHNTIGIEVGGVGASGLLLDQTANQTGTGSPNASGTTAALAADEVFLVAATSYDSSQASITVGSATPAWTQEFEDLTFTVACGEVDSRIVTGTAGTTQSATWNAAAVQWGAGIAAFAGPATAAHAESFLLVPV